MQDVKRSAKQEERNKPKIITISGAAGSGKDSFASLLQKELIKRGVRTAIYHYADPLKMCLTNYYHWDGQKDEVGRSLLQHVGTDIVRARNEDGWLEIAEAFIDNVLFMSDVILIPDCRFPNEITYWGHRKLATIKVKRPFYETALTQMQQTHSSETSLNKYTFDYVVCTSNLEELHEKARQLAKIMF